MSTCPDCQANLTASETGQHSRFHKSLPYFPCRDCDFTTPEFKDTLVHAILHGHLLNTLRSQPHRTRRTNHLASINQLCEPVRTREVYPMNSNQQEPFSRQEGTEAFETYQSMAIPEQGVENLPTPNIESDIMPTFMESYDQKATDLNTIPKTNHSSSLVKEDPTCAQCQKTISVRKGRTSRCRTATAAIPNQAEDEMKIRNGLKKCFPTLHITWIGLR